jgi:hypothetical protein
MVESKNFQVKIIQAVNSYAQSANKNHLKSILEAALKELGPSSAETLQQIGYPCQFQFIDEPQDVQDVGC